jgi:hypothetical protein
MLQPPGPAAFTGEVVLTTGATDLLEAEDGTGSGKFCWVVAHELVHVIEAMRVIVPAFMDWETYWSVALQNGVAGDSAVVASKGKVTATVAEDSVNETLVPEVEKALKKSAK